MGLTEKEITVLRLRAEGLTQVEIAKRLDVSQAAVSDFEKNARRKLLEALEMIEFARENDISLPSPPPYRPTGQSGQPGRKAAKEARR